MNLESFLNTPSFIQGCMPTRASTYVSLLGIKPEEFYLIGEIDIFWGPLMETLVAMKPLPKVRFLVINNIDRGIQNYEDLSDELKRVFHNLTYLFISQNYSSLPEGKSDNVKSWYRFYHNLYVDILYIGDNQSEPIYYEDLPKERMSSCFPINDASVEYTCWVEKVQPKILTKGVIILHCDEEADSDDFQDKILEIYDLK